MNYKRCMYFVEGDCEEQLINALKLEPRRLIPGKVKVHNVIYIFRSMKSAFTGFEVHHNGISSPSSRKVKST